MGISDFQPDSYFNVCVIVQNFIFRKMESCILIEILHCHYNLNTIFSTATPFSLNVLFP